MTQYLPFLKLIENPENPFRKAGFIFFHTLDDLVRLHLSRHDQAEIVNLKEIRIIGLKRTGNHAIINWIKKQQTGVIWNINDVPVNKNPHRHRYEYLKFEYPFKQIPLKKIAQCKKEAKGEFSKKDCLLYSYEDHTLTQIASPHFERMHDLYLGKSLERYDVLILRDPFNLLASRLKSNFTKVKARNQTFTELWISYAKEFLGETEYLKHNKICINYNRWFQDIDYRKQLASQLKSKFSDKGINQISGIGKGSSFDNLDFQGKAFQMDVFNRWRNFSADQSFLNQLNDRELLEYSKQIFGHIPGTEELKLSFK